MNDVNGKTGPAGDCPTVTEEEFKAKIYPRNNIDRTGRAIIINNDTFEEFTKKGGNQKAVRDQSRIDAIEMVKVLKKLGYEIIRHGESDIHENLSKDCLVKTMEDAASLNYGAPNERYGAFLCVIMSFGEEGVLICPGKAGKDDRCELKTIQLPFRGDKCKSLATRPKIFFIVGNVGYKDRDIPEGGPTSLPPKLVSVVPKKIPRESNFITHYSTADSERKWKKNECSPYIRALIDAFETHVVDTQGEGMDLLKLLTRVNGKMAVGGSEIPLVTSLLTKRYHFKNES